MYGRTATLSYPTQTVLGKDGVSKVKKTVRSGNGLPSLFPINWYVFGADWSARADWISSSDMPSKESVVTTPREEFKDVCRFTRMGWEPRRLAFNKRSVCFPLQTSSRSVPFFSLESFFTFPAILSEAFCRKNGLMFRIVLPVDMGLNVKKLGAGIFKPVTIDVGLELFWELLGGNEVLVRDGAIMERSPLQNRRRQHAIGGDRKKKTPQSSRSVPAWVPPSRPNLRKYFRRIIDTGKSYTIGELRLYIPTMGITVHGPPLYATQTKIGPHGFRILVVDYIAAPSER
jgi:hypothetical protein